MNFSAAYMQEKELSAGLALVVHVLLFVLLFFGVQWQTKHPAAVEVELWSRLPDMAASPAQKSEPPQKVEPKIEPPPATKPEPKIEPRAEIRKPDIALKNKAEKEKLEKQRQDMKQKAAQEQRQMDLNRMVQAELSSAQTRNSADYYGRIIGKIKGNIVVPPDIPGNPEAVFDVVQLPSGEVISAKLKKSSGYKPYDDAVERAILKSSPLPKPDRADLFARNLELKFRQKD